MYRAREIHHLSQDGNNKIRSFNLSTFIHQYDEQMILIISTHKEFGPHIKQQKYTNMISIAIMSKSEIDDFNKERNGSTGTTIVCPYLEDAEDASDGSAYGDNCNAECDITLEIIDLLSTCDITFE